ncbi:MFS transporter [Actinomycetota bacterium]
MNRTPWPAVVAVGVLLAVSFGTVLYGFSIYVTDSAAGAEFSSSMLSLAYAGSVVASGLLATPLGKWMDRHGARSVAAFGGVITCAGLFAFSLSSNPLTLLASWWLIIGPGTAMTYYEPAFVVINQNVSPARRPHALGIVTLIGGLAGAIFIPVIEFMNSSLGWRPTVRLLGAAIALIGVGGALLIPRRTSEQAQESVAQHVPLGEILRDRRFTYLTTGLVLAFMSFNGIVAHRVDRFVEAGFAVGLVALLAAVASLVSMPGRFLGPFLGGRRRGIEVLQGFLVVVAISIALAIPDGAAWLMYGHFVLFGLAFGAVLPLRALAMDQWYGRNHYGRRMGIQQSVTLVVGGLGPLAVGVARDLTGGFTIPMVGVFLAAVAGLFFVALAQRAPAPSEPVAAEG